MRAISRAELTALIRDGDGVVLVDHVARGSDRASTLHALSCRWPKRTGARTPLRFAESPRAAMQWLRRERGDEGEGWKRCPECGAVATASDVDSAPPGRSAGEPVWTTDRGRDLAWVIEATPTDVAVAAFDAPGRTDVDRRVVRLGATSSFVPEAGDRCFFETDGTWRAGRVVKSPGDSDDEVVVLCDGDILQVPRTSIRFRRLAALNNPLHEFAEHRAGDRERYLSRHRFSDVYARLAAPSRGLIGISSGAVDLHPHQIGVARRILADPVQRYLLADEVGLGKTIEAGFVIRQRLIDAPRSAIVVLVPGALVWQWQEELESKFGLSEFRRGGIEISSYERARAFDRRFPPDLLVIDEAHRIAAGWRSPVKELVARFDAARDVAHRVPRLLLLSATPVLHREHDLLAMLHLLDPDTYRLEDLESFTARVRDRERIGELLLSLRPQAPAFLLASRLPDLRDAFSGDPRMSQILDGLEQTLESDQELERERLLADARGHISETYQLHRRLLRNRRASIAGTSYAVRGRDGFTLVHDGDARRTLVDTWLERWRTTLLSDAYDRGGEDELDKAAEAFLVFLGASTADPEVLRDLASYRLSRKRAFRAAAGLGPEERIAAIAFDLSDEQRAVLDELFTLLGDDESHRDSRLREVAEELMRRAVPATVVFATSPEAVSALAERLADAGAEVFTYSSDLTDDERRAAATAFIEAAGERFLVTDATGEEGLNLQAADRVVHLDLPLSTTRVEQRIGRVDRHGNAAPVYSLVVDPGPAEGFGHWWLSALRDAFHVFDTTTAPVQYAIETVERDLLRSLFLEGVDEAHKLLPDVHQRVAEEQSRIEKVDSLDALAKQDSDDVQFVEAVRSVDREVAGDFARSVLSALDAQREDLDSVVVARRDGGRTVEVQHQPPALRVFSGVNRAIAVTANRRLAVTDRSLSLLRPGAPLVEALRLHQDWDDRSQTAAVWVHEPERPDDLVAIRCDLIVRADPSAAFVTWKRIEATRPRSTAAIRTDADAPLALAALQRRVDAYLAPVHTSVWVDGDGHLIDDPSLIAYLQNAVAAEGNAAIRSEESWRDVARISGVLSTADLVEPVLAAAHDAALSSGRLVDLAEQASVRARRDWEGIDRLLTLRAEISLDAKSAIRDLAAEREVSGVLLDALRKPAARWSGACLLVVSSREASSE